MKGISSKAAVNVRNKYLYYGKEIQANEFNDGSGLEWADYGARMYDAQLGRWHTIDPLAEKYPDWSPYAFVLNDPINLIDIDGREPGPKPTAKDVKATLGQLYKTYKFRITITKAATAAIAAYYGQREAEVRREIERLKSPPPSERAPAGGFGGGGAGGSWDYNPGVTPPKPKPRKLTEAEKKAAAKEKKNKRLRKRSRSI